LCLGTPAEAAASSQSEQINTFPHLKIRPGVDLFYKDWRNPTRQSHREETPVLFLRAWAPHGLLITHMNKLNTDLHTFIRGQLP
jgi:hypothetical protein